MKTQHTPKLSYDGYGINGTDEYGTRLATFNLKSPEDITAYGRLFASAPELLEALEGALSMLELLNAPGTHDPVEARVYAARAAIAKAKGEK